MCPLCLSAAGWLAIAGGSASTLAMMFGLKLKGSDDGDDRDDASNRDA
jgi:hypothetical protein